MDKKTEFLKIDYSILMDLRVDYAFKLIFGTGDTLFLISLLNAIFANKKIPRIIKSLTIVNPYLEKHSKEDKLSIENICKEQEEIGMAVSALVRLSEDKVTRQAYQKRRDEIMLFNKRVKDYEQMKQRAEQAEAENENLRSRLAELEEQSKA